MRLTSLLPLALMLLAVIVAVSVVPWTSVIFWANDAQRAFQNQMASALSAMRTGDMSVIWALCGATATYGFVHALGPGHGKVLLGGAALATRATLRRMIALTVISSLAQDGTAILLVGVLAAVLGLSAQSLGPIADNWLAPFSYVAIASVGAYLAWRGLQDWRSARTSPTHGHTHSHGDDGKACCGHAHGLSLQEVEGLRGLRESALLVMSIAIRPCTGAIFVLVIALRVDIFWVGCLAVVAMGLGTAAFNLLVAASGVAARHISSVNAKSGDSIVRVAALVQMFGGLLILSFCALWLMRFSGLAAAIG